jgi:RNA polymerase sigma-70 factor (ECF subfamily)
MAAELPTEVAEDARADALLIAEQERRHNRSRIDESLALLPERYRQAIWLRLIEELSREECARRMDITVGNFDVVLFRAVRSFRKRFGDRGDGAA